MASIIKTVSVPVIFKEKLDDLEEKLQLKNHTFSGWVTDKLIKEYETKVPSVLTLESDFDEIQEAIRKLSIGDMKKISHKANVMMITLEAQIKWNSYEGYTGKKFTNPREAERYLRQ